MELTPHQQSCQNHIAAAEKAGLPLAIYAREHNINVLSLYGEKSRLSRLQRKSTPGIVRVENVSTPVLSPALLQIRLPNGITLALPSHHQSLDQILQSLVKL